MAKKTKDSNLSIEERLEQALIPNWDEPYKLPENWCWVKLGSVSKLYNGDRGVNYPSKKDYVSKGIPFINAGAIQNCSLVETEFNFISKEKYEALRAGKIEKNDILYCLRGSLGKTALIESNLTGAISSSLCIIRAKNNVIPKYLFYLLRSDFIVQQQNKAENGSAQPNLSAASVMEYILPLAPLEEQKRIISCVESLFSKLDETQEKAQEVLDGFETRKAAILHKAFSGELTAKWRKENKVSFEEWENLTLDDVADYKKGPFGSSITKAMFVPKGENTFKVYEQGNAIRKTLDYGSYYISQKKYEELKGFAVKPGDIIVSCAGTIGEIYKLPNHCEAGVINQALMRVRVYSNINELYFIYYFTGVLKGDVIGEANGTAIKNIPPFKVLKAMNILLPSLPEQNKIVEILDCMLSKEQQVKETAEAVIEQIDTMKKAILARAFRGELGTNDSSEESAVELLKQVLNTVSEPKKSIKRTTIPKALDNRIKTDLEHKIIILYFQNEVDILSIDLIMGVSSKKFEIMEALRNLQQRGLIEKQNDKYKLLG